jgi:Ca2+-binding EF-hand superfamily protein
MGASNSAQKKSQELQIDLAYYRKQNPTLSDEEILQIFQLFKSLEPDERGLVNVEDIRYLYKNSMERDQLRE